MGPFVLLRKRKKGVCGRADFSSGKSFVVVVVCIPVRMAVSRVVRFPAL